jgi:hypothetical protein
MSKIETHLGMIQNVVERMGQNSFLIKGWCITLVSALFALSAKDSQISFVYLAYLPVIIFWGLDGYFLWQERLFRKLYDHVRNLSEDKIDYSMNRSDLEITKKETWICSTFSKTLIPFYSVLLVSVIAVMILIIFNVI